MSFSPPYLFRDYVLFPCVYNCLENFLKLNFCMLVLHNCLKSIFDSGMSQVANNHRRAFAL